jgi:predicted molibdopterin-dependent oxidoreductase YjgC
MDATNAEIEIEVDGRVVRAPADATVAAVLLSLGVGAFRRSVTGGARLPLCGMGTCQECRVTIDGVAHRRACLTPVRAGMKVSTDG